MTARKVSHDAAAEALEELREVYDLDGEDGGGAEPAFMRLVAYVAQQRAQSAADDAVLAAAEALLRGFSEFNIRALDTAAATSRKLRSLSSHPAGGRDGG